MNIITRSFLSTVAAGLLVGAPISLPIASADQPPPGRNQPYDHDNDCDGDRGGWKDHKDKGDRCDGPQSQRDDRKEWRDTRDNSRWDGSQHNGYYSENKWHYGPPAFGAQNTRGFAYGYHPWQSGERLGYYNNRYAEVNYRAQNLKKPSRGYRWVRDDRGIFIMASRTSGLIRMVLNRNAY